MMLEHLLLSAGSIVAALVAGAILGELLGGGSIVKLTLQTLVAGVNAIALDYLYGIGPDIASTIVVGPAVLVVIARGLLWRQEQKALGGDYGEEVQWAAELEQSDDELFQRAVESLDDSDLREIGVIAESKEELRELTVQRFEELAAEEVPELDT